MSQPTRRVESKNSCNMILHTLKMTTTRDMNRAQRAVRLEVTDVGLHRWSYALSFQRALEGGVRHQNRYPVQHGDDRDQADEVLEDLRGRFARVHVRESGEDARREDGDDWSSVRSGLTEDLEGLTVFCEAVDLCADHNQIATTLI